MGILSLMGGVASGVRAMASDPNVKKGLVGFVPVRKVLAGLNGVFADHYEKLTWAEISEVLTKEGVWHNRVAMPYQMAAYPTACNSPAAGVSRSNNEVVVHSPVFLRRHAAAKGRLLSKL